MQKSNDRTRRYILFVRENTQFERRALRFQTLPTAHSPLPPPGVIETYENKSTLMHAPSNSFSSLSLALACRKMNKVEFREGIKSRITKAKSRKANDIELRFVFSAWSGKSFKENRRSRPERICRAAQQPLPASTSGKFMLILSGPMNER